MLSVKKWYIPLRITELLSGRRRQKENVLYVKNKQEQNCKVSTLNGTKHKKKFNLIQNN